MARPPSTNANAARPDRVVASLPTELGAAAESARPRARRLRSRRPLVFAAALVGVPFACKAQLSDDTAGDSGLTAGTAGGAAVSGMDAGVAGSIGTGGSRSIDVPDASTPDLDRAGAGGAGGENNCAGEEHPAELVPIDMYVMLDRSLSMNAATSGGTSKWDAITGALEAFVSDPNSDGIGVGIQYFPANKPCTGDDECDSGLCYLKACRASRSTDPSLPGLIPCVRDADCPGSGDSCVDLGSCGDESCVSVGSTCDNDLECAGLTEGVCASQTVCSLSDYTTPEVPIGVLPGASQALLDSLARYSPAQNPFGLTPTGPALEGAISYARSWAEAHPARKAIVVLATDGAPTGGCTPSRRAEIAALASVGAGASVPVQTYTIGVFSPEDPSNPDSTEGPDNIRAIAEAGNGQAFVISDQDDVAAQFVDALNSVRGHGLACNFQIPAPKQGKLLDFGKVNVVFTPKAGEDAETIPYLDDGSQCDADGGWYYDIDPVSEQPRSIQTCDATCTRLTNSVTGNVSITVGCETIRKQPIK